MLACPPDFVIRDVLNLDPDMYLTKQNIQSRSSIQTYTHSCSLEDLNITIHWAVDLEDSFGGDYSRALKTRVVMSGSAVDAYGLSQKAMLHDLNMPDIYFDWVHLFNSIKHLNGRFNRIDLTRDAINHELIPMLREIIKSVHDKCWFSSARRYKIIQSGELQTDEDHGSTVYIGTRPQMLRIYDKLKERENAYDAPPEDIKSWVRFELQVSDKKADQLADMIIEKGLTESFSSVMGAHYRVLSPRTAKRVRDSKLNAWEAQPAKWWKEITSTDHVFLYAKEPYADITKTEQWIDTTKPSSYRIKLYHDFLDYMNGEPLDNDISPFTDLLDRLVTDQEKDGRYYRSLLTKAKTSILPAVSAYGFESEALYAWLKNRTDELIRIRNGQRNTFHEKLKVLGAI